VATNLYRSELRRHPARTVSSEDVSELPFSCPSDGGLAEEDLRATNMTRTQIWDGNLSSTAASTHPKGSPCMVFLEPRLSELHTSHQTFGEDCIGQLAEATCPVTALIRT
jgi:hypothetical protein